MDLESSSPTVEFPKTVGPLMPQVPEARRVDVDVAALSHPGRVRPTNEDHFLIVRPSRTMEVLASNLPEGSVPVIWEQSGYAYLIADGLGGMAAGEYASMLALRACIAGVLKSDRWCFRPDRQTGPELIRRIRGYYHQVDEVLQQHARARPELAGMATT